MKKYLITKRDGSTSEMKTSDEQSFIDWRDQCISVNCWGKPEREIVEFSEYYGETDVLSRRSEETFPAVYDGETLVSEAVIVNYVTLKKEYVIEEIPLDNDPQWLLQECYRNRQLEYPTIQEIAEALMEKFGENKNDKFDLLHSRRVATKLKYPKPQGV